MPLLFMFTRRNLSCSVVTGMAMAMAMVVLFVLSVYPLGVVPSSAAPIHHETATMEIQSSLLLPPNYRFGLRYNSRNWPSFELNWKVLIGSGIGFIGGAAGSAGGIGGGGIFVPMLSLIMGFDSKTSTALSKCMIMGAAISTVYVNLRTKHPRFNLPVIDYSLVTLFQPMLLLGVSIGVTLNVIFPEWLVLLLFIMMCADRNDDYKSIPSGPNNEMESSGFYLVWKETILLLLMWFCFLAIQILKVETTICSTNYWLIYILQVETTICSTNYWLIYILQVPAAFSLTLYQSAFLYKRSRQVVLDGDVDKLSGTLSVKWSIRRISLYAFCGIFAGIMGGLVGIGGGGIIGSLFLEIGLPPEVSTATATFVMLFSSSMSVVEYIFLQWFPWEYGLLLTIVALFGGFFGQYMIRQLVQALGRSSPIIFILCAVAFISAFSLGSIKIVTIIENIQDGVYMGFENICTAD